jgi:hypothetical protein
MDCAQRHVGFASSAFGHDPRRFGRAQILRGAGDGKRLRWQCLAQESCERWRNGVFGALKWRISFENARAKLDRVGS